MRKLCQKWFAK